MSEQYKNPASDQESLVPIGVVLADVLESLRKSEIPDCDPGRPLAARIGYLAQLDKVIKEDISLAEAEGRPTADLEAESRDTNTQIYETKQGFMPGQETRPQ